MAQLFSALLLDIDNVILEQCATCSTALPARKIKSILDSPIWHEYERGDLTKEQCNAGIFSEFGTPVESWEATLDQLGSTLTPNTAFIQAIRDMKSSYPGLDICSFSNISEPDFEAYMRKLIEPLGIFKLVFTSASLRHRKPDLASYKKVLKLIGVSAKNVIFMDDEIENILPAKSLGLHAIHFDTTENVIAHIHDLLGDPVDRGMEFLRKTAGKLFSETDQGVPIRDNWSQLLILHYLGSRDLVTLENNKVTWCYFMNDAPFTDKNFPDDADTSALAMQTLETTEEHERFLMAKIMDNLSIDKLPWTYFDKNRPRFDPAVAANVLRFFYINGQGHKLDATLEFLCNILDSGAYELGSRYYCQPDWLIHLVVDLCLQCDDPALAKLRRIARVQLERRLGADKDVHGAALRLLSAQALGLSSPRDLELLLRTQQLDGGWPLVWMCKYGKVAVNVGSRGTTTALAVKATRTAQERGET